MVAAVRASNFRNLLRKDFDAALEPITQLQKDHPEVAAFCHGLTAWLAINNGKPERAREELEKSNEALPKFKELAARAPHLLKLLPTQADLDNALKPTPQVISPLVPNKLWTVQTGFASPSEVPHAEVLIVSSVFRLNDGSLVIINPGVFSADTVARINGLGNVAALITPTGGHGAGLANANKQWPNAKLYGTDPRGMHGRKNLPWAGFVGVGEPLPFSHELQPINIEGHFFSEVMFYNPATRALLGSTDLALDNASSFNLGLYSFGLGGPFNSRGATTSISMQSYHLLFGYNRDALRRSLSHIVSLDPVLVPFGHGGVVKSAAELHDVYGALFAPTGRLSSIESFFVPVAYFIDLLWSIWF
eukprot:TRINITY_DN18931_c0_g1_i1.p1 TRINITY_DN18931_c0_g1~~TRINITY_DN18931_c0_g1_i1.p1  ORF type:complete len:419 (-),score=84.68 TRINITY_DN18931_c0_g1_i1:25-1110(-)